MTSLPFAAMTLRRLLIAALSLTGVLWVSMPERAAATETTAPVTATQCDWYGGRRCEPVTRAVSNLANFTDWLTDNDVPGYIGEVGWPKGPADAARWNAVAEAWYQAADRANLWVTAWGATEWWRQQNSLAAYQESSLYSGLDAAMPQSRVIEAHPSIGDRWRGIDIGGGDSKAPNTAATSTFSNSTPGVYGIDYRYDSAASLQYLSSRGIKVVRIAFRWERVQPRLMHDLDPTALADLKAVVARANDAGLKVILDMHNYGAYYRWDGTMGVRQPLGAALLPIGAFADAWQRIAQAFKGAPNVLGYGLMNEPVGIPPRNGLAPAVVWEKASQAALTSIRALGDRRTVLVAGYQFGGVTYWRYWHPKAWIKDPVQHFRYDAHAYFDIDHSGEYKQTYDQDLAAVAG